MTLSYLVSTAGHAQYQNDENPHDVRTILQLILDGAEEFGEEKVVGFTSAGKDGRWRCDIYSFAELLTLSNGLAEGLKRGGIHPCEGKQKILSLLCPTGLEFLLAWISLMRLGYGVVFIAPQCSPSAINHLVTSTSSTHLLYHPMYTDLAHSAKELDLRTNHTELPALVSYQTETPTQTSLVTSTVTPELVSHIFHTSGTSGTPKPIPLTHGGSVSVLPRRAIPSYLRSTPTSIPPSETATFTTTPLFHGGVSDLLRAWMARSMIYFYPTSSTPITTDNIVKAVEACNSPPEPLLGQELSEAGMQERAKRFRVGSFLSVPYILTVISEDVDGPGIEMLRSMELVSTGGAPLDTKVGDRMVEKGVKLVSRLGSSEAGFLLTSHRDYENEKDWEWLRNDSPYSAALRFETVESDGAADGERFEMIVTPEWKSKTKTNREDGSYATGDLYQRHPTKQNVWMFRGKGDDVLVMGNGEKASPGPIETILRSSPLLSDALVVGADKTQLGLLLFPRASPAPPDILDLIASLLAEANQSSPSYAQISKEMCLIISDPGKIVLLPRSSKGTIQRGLAYEVFREEIDKLYDVGLSTHRKVEKRSLAEIKSYLTGVIMEVMGSKRKGAVLDETTDLFSWGVDSLMATRIRSSILKAGCSANLNVGSTTLPTNIVFEKPSVARLSQYIYNLQEGGQVGNDDVEKHPHRFMEELVEKYGTFSSQAASTHHANGTSTVKSGKTILLTGVTGSLGSYILSQLNLLPPSVVDKIICLVRADDDTAARTRVTESLRQRGLNHKRQRYEVYPADLTEAELGLNSEVYQELVAGVDTVIHAAWPVHFGSSLVSFEDNIKGTRNLLDLMILAKTHRPSFYFCSSLASVLARPPPDRKILEIPSDDPSTASPIGYSQSKWVTEMICRRANETGRLKGGVHVLRVGQLCGDIERGYWNEKEGWPLLVRTAQTSGSLPLLHEKPSWLPVDLAALAIIEVITGDRADSPFIYHIVHPSMIEWNTVLDGLKAAGIAFERVEQRQWLNEVEKSSDDPVENPSKQMLSMWKAGYGSEKKTLEPVIDSKNAQAASTTLRNIEPIDTRFIEKMVAAWRKSGFLR